jgi:hypothetical protein
MNLWANGLGYVRPGLELHEAGAILMGLAKGRLKN